MRSQLCQHRLVAKMNTIEAAYGCGTSPVFRAQIV
jgi:hypothetical protein